MRTIAVILGFLSLGSSGCYSPLRTAGSDRAIAAYREGRAPSGALAIRQEGHSRTARSSASGGGRLPVPSTLTVDEAIARARENSARLAELVARADAATAAIEAAGQYQNPELQVTQGRLDQMLDQKPHVKPTLRFRPSRPGEIDARVAAARAQEIAAQAQVRAEELSIDADIRWLFDDVLLLDAELAAADGVAGARRTLSTRMKERGDAGAATQIDENMAELFAVEAEQASAERRMRRSSALADLLDRLGIDPTASVRLVGDPISAWPPPPLPKEQVLVEAALQSSPQVGIAASRIDGADARLRIERGKRWPWFTFVDVGYVFEPGTAAGRAWVLQAGVEVPLFNTNRGGVLAAEAARTAEERALLAGAEQVAREVRARLREVQTAAALVTDFRGRALPVIERTNVEAKRALENSGIDVIRALVVDERRVLVELRFLGLVRRYRTAVAELCRAIGGRLPIVP